MCRRARITRVGTRPRRWPVFRITSRSRAATPTRRRPRLVRLTKPVDVAPADQRAPEVEERLVGVVPPLVAHLQAPVAVQPRQSPLHHPPVPPQPFAGLDPAPSDARSYAPLPQGLPAPGEVVALVGVQLLGALARATARLTDRSHGVYRLLQYLGVVDVGRRVDHRERDAVSLDHEVPLGARFAPVRRVRASLFAPPGAATAAESKDARSQSISSARPRRSKSAWCRRSHTPASCHSSKRRQQV